jgi:hypothetical protein
MASYDYTFVSGDTVTPTKLNDARTVGDIVNADVSATAAIAGTKVAPAFGAQDITVSGGARLITNTSDFALIFGTNNTERARINNLGNVGIGTTSIGARIDAVSSGAILRVASSDTSGYGFISYGRSATATNNWHVGSEGDGTLRFYNGNLGVGAERMRIDASGNVGIGTTSPTNIAGYSTLEINNSTN